ncbi:hypothetical protein DPMN_063938 [Dreissena polymorpha]|uniref:Uncharacterized protein n=1 Tax=Dreissena polymorpha TaxID=45954 RepID=A0A9D4HJ20_DREPO|nr:hypothetical protein DPMN_063938 [Dreissena polymorpha]
MDPSVHRFWSLVGRRLLEFKPFATDKVSGNCQRPLGFMDNMYPSRLSDARNHSLKSIVHPLPMTKYYSSVLRTDLPI